MQAVKFFKGENPMKKQILSTAIAALILLISLAVGVHRHTPNAPGQSTAVNGTTETSSEPVPPQDSPTYGGSDLQQC